MWARRLHRWSRRRDSNPEPAVYKTAALPIELRRRGAWAPKGCRKRPRMIGPAAQDGQAAPGGRRPRRGAGGRGGGGARGVAPGGAAGPLGGGGPVGARAGTRTRARRRGGPGVGLTLAE